jgi:Mn-dependent DtxR family transcriptional regulator
MDFRRFGAILSGFTTTTESRPPGNGYLTSAEVAQRLGVSQSTKSGIG